MSGPFLLAFSAKFMYTVNNGQISVLPQKRNMTLNG